MYKFRWNSARLIIWSTSYYWCISRDERATCVQRRAALDDEIKRIKYIKSEKEKNGSIELCVSQSMISDFMIWARPLPYLLESSSHVVRQRQRRQLRAERDVERREEKKSIEWTERNNIHSQHQHDHQHSLSSKDFPAQVSSQRDGWYQRAGFSSLCLISTNVCSCIRVK